jgi:hypothetical protein
MFFYLKPGDGTIRAHIAAVQLAYKDFRHLALTIAELVNLRLD